MSNGNYFKLYLLNINLINLIYIESSKQLHVQDMEFR